MLKNFKPKKKDGLKASYVNEIWHMDVTHLSLVDDIEVYLQAIIDNFSRKIISWNLSTEINSQNTKNLLKKARRVALGVESDSVTKVIVDQGKENRASAVTNFCFSAKNLQRLFARVEIKESNSMVEAFFRSLKNNYLLFQKCTSFEELKRRIAFYIREHNQVLPHNAFNGATPEEIYRGEWSVDQEVALKESIQAALRKRRESSKIISCATCA